MRNLCVVMLGYARVAQKMLKIGKPSGQVRGIEGKTGFNKRRRDEVGLRPVQSYFTTGS